MNFQISTNRQERAYRGWQRNPLDEMRIIDCERTMFEKIALLAAKLGFEFCSYYMRTPLPVTNPVAMTISNYPDILKRACELADYVNIDPLVPHALSSIEMTTWTNERFSRNPEVWHAARAAGILSGVSQPTRGMHGVIGLLDLSGYNRAISATEVEEKKSSITWLASIAHQSLSPYLIENFMPSTEVKLSGREISVLRWLAEGKTSEDIAEILNVVKRTVDFHISNAVKKMGATNRTAATVQAALLGLLE